MPVEEDSQSLNPSEFRCILAIMASNSNTIANVAEWFKATDLRKISQFLTSVIERCVSSNLTVCNFCPRAGTCEFLTVQDQSVMCDEGAS